MDWSSAFDEAHPQPGATDAVIARFVAEVTRALSAVEMEEISATQINPFPASDPFHSTWRPFDASSWVLPSGPLPPAYLALLRWSDGGEFRQGVRWFQFFPTLDPTQGVRAMLLAYHLPQYMPGALPIAFDGDGTFYLLDMRHPPRAGEYPVVCAHSANLGWEPESCERVADTFLALLGCRGQAAPQSGLSAPDGPR